MKSFLIIGLGRFGSALATELCAQGSEVLALDLQMDRVQAVADRVTKAVAADARDPEVLKGLGARNFDCAVVAFSNEVGDSALIALNLKELGIAKVAAKACSAVHRKVLEKIGVDQVIFPEQEMALRLARSLSSRDVLNFIELSQEFSIVERTLPPAWAEHSLVELDIRAKFDLNVIAVRRGEEMTVSPGRDFRFQKGDTLVLLGANRNIERMEAL